jgi:hypothetical protein
VDPTKVETSFLAAIWVSGRGIAYVGSLAFALVLMDLSLNKIVEIAQNCRGRS